ncbi:hypothetical protein REPUB_Repub20aG0088200 [Reevesia pubescens]
MVEGLEELWSKLSLTFMEKNKIHGLHLGFMNEKVGQAIGNIIGKVEEVESKDETESWGRSLKVRVAIDAVKQMMKGTKEPILDHIEIDCLKAMKSKNKGLPLLKEYGSWLKDNVLHVWKIKLAEGTVLWVRILNPRRWKILAVFSGRIVGCNKVEKKIVVSMRPNECLRDSKARKKFW